ncbi:MAG: tRNA lysidine(34) synthetase TilS [Desulfuromonadaceae bacterium]|nr:tRNA lysidine(34) synthetase TilS [Desulfuromonadaceae bacterium]
MISFDAALAARVAKTALTHHLFSPGDTLIVAYSGGGDSTALLDLLSRLPDFNLSLVVAHLNHRLRGAESDADEEFCRAVAVQQALPFECRSVDVKLLAAENGLNLEDAGRRARIEFFDDICKKYRASSVVLAHHADDQAETVLMRLLRGSGMSGLSGIAYRNTRGYVRPLLDITRAEIEHYLRKRDLSWREDASNSDTTYLRNRIRYQLLPQLEEYNPSIRSCLVSTASRIRDAESLLEELTERTFTEICCTEGNQVVSSVARLRTLSVPLQKRVLRHAILRLTGSLTGIGQRHIDAMVAGITSERPGSQLILPNDVRMVREYDRLILTQDQEKDCTADFELLISSPGCYTLPTGGRLTISQTDAAPCNHDSDTMCCNLATTPFPWLIRSFRPGDRMVPFGMNGRKKVKDIFIDRKIPRAERARIPLLFCGEDLIWVAGVCGAEQSRLSANTTTCMKAVFVRR